MSRTVLGQPLATWLASALIGLAMPASSAAAQVRTQLCIYGGTASGVAAAVQASRLGLSAVLVEPTQHLGGLTTGGLGATDVGSGPSIGGLAKEFYGAVREYYATTYGEDSPQVKDANGGYRFEPSVAELLIERWLEGTGVVVLRGGHLTQAAKDGAKLVNIVLSNGQSVAAEQYIDASYEGDLMAAAGVEYHVGREANRVYGETLNGIQFLDQHNFKVPIDPWKVPGDPNSGLLWGISPEAPGNAGDGDTAVQAYNYRMCLTKAENRIRFAAPDGYDRERYALLARYINAGVFDALNLTIMMPNGKTDTNNYGAFSSDYIGGNHAYPEADWAERQAIIADHRNYQQGMMYFLANDESVPENVRAAVGAWGLPVDEFTDNGGWARQLYIREARRMVGAYVMTEANCRGQALAPDSVGLASYGMDSHNCRRIVIDGVVRNEGDVQVGVAGPYPIAYDAITPRAEQCSNLLVPVCLSSSHIAFGSIRMEPVFMITGQSAATAAWLALRDDVNVQDIDRAALRERLLADKQVLEWDPRLGARTVADKIDPAGLPGVALDDQQAELAGEWIASTIAHTRLLGTGYVHDGNANKGALSATFRVRIPVAGRYRVLLLATPNDNRATNVPVTLRLNDEPLAEMTINMRDASAGGRLLLGEWHLPADGQLSVTVSNADTNGYVVLDGLHCEPVADSDAAGPAT